MGQQGVDVTSGADMIRQSPAAGQVDELTIIVAPIVLGAGGSSC
ncbi:MAG: dihydrofolate reductase family protein [Propionibacteriaceae bacterium]